MSAFAFILTPSGEFVIGSNCGHNTLAGQFPNVFGDYNDHRELSEYLEDCACGRIFPNTRKIWLRVGNIVDDYKAVKELVNRNMVDESWTVKLVDGLTSTVGELLGGYSFKQGNAIDPVGFLGGNIDKEVSDPSVPGFMRRRKYWPTSESAEMMSCCKTCGSVRDDKCCKMCLFEAKQKRPMGLCVNPGCKKAGQEVPIYAHGLCSTCYQRKSASEGKGKGYCGTPGCSNATKLTRMTKGLCPKCYTKQNPSGGRKLGKCVNPGCPKIGQEVPIIAHGLCNTCRIRKDSADGKQRKKGYCGTPGCPNATKLKQLSRGLCTTCYQKQYPSNRKMGPCANQSCDKAGHEVPIVARGLCQSCYLKWNTEKNKGLCSTPGCGKTGRLRNGLCVGCYRKEKPPQRTMGVCKGSSCPFQGQEVPIKAHGLCDRCYGVYRVHKLAKGVCGNRGCATPGGVRYLRSRLCYFCFHNYNPPDDGVGVVGICVNKNCTNPGIPTRLFFGKCADCRNINAELKCVRGISSDRDDFSGIAPVGRRDVVVPDDFSKAVPAPKREKGPSPMKHRGVDDFGGEEFGDDDWNFGGDFGWEDDGVEDDGIEDYDTPDEDAFGYGRFAKDFDFGDDFGDNVEEGS